MMELIFSEREYRKRERKVKTEKLHINGEGEKERRKGT